MLTDQLNSPPAEGALLLRVPEVSLWLDETTSIPDVQELHRRAAAYEKYWREHADAFDQQNRAAEIRLRAERRLGTLLKATVVKGGTRRFRTSSTGRPQLEGAERSLPNGIDQQDSHLYQHVARVPEAILLAYLDTFPPGTRRARTSRGLLAFAKKQQRVTQATLDIAPGGCADVPTTDAPPPPPPPEPTTTKRVVLTAATVKHEAKLAKDFRTQNSSDTLAAVYAWACEERGL